MAIINDEEVSYSGYESLVEYYIDNIQPNALFFDCYPLSDPHSINPVQDLFYCIDIIARKSAANKIPFNYIFCSFAYLQPSGWKFLSEFATSYQIHTGLFYGAKGITYWNANLYISTFPTAHIELIKNTNKKILDNEDILLSLEFKSAYHKSTKTTIGARKDSIPNHSKWQYFSSDPYANEIFNVSNPLIAMSGSTIDSLAVSFLTDDLGNRYFWVFNKSLCSSESIQLNLKNGGKVVDVLSENPCFAHNSVIQLNAAEAKLFKFISSQQTPTVKTIAQNTIWETKNVINEKIVVKPSATLTIKGNTFFTSNASIIVEPGGRLIIDGGTLTNVCDGELWQGIEVLGNIFLQQNATNQGIVELKNGARIENAICGISVGRPGRNLNDGLIIYPGVGGGIVYANNAHFINNQKAVYFATHVGGFNTSSQANNKSYFKNCEFILDDNALFDAPGTAQVELQGVKGVSFQNSLFKDERDRYSKSHLTNGIYANGASIRVGSSYWSLAPFSSDGCEFSGFDRAIYIQNSSTHQSQIYFSKFFNNGIGIDSYASNGLIVEGCEFHIPGYVYDNSRKQDGIRIEKSSGFTIENNFFTGDEGGNGIHFKDNGVGNHFVKSNSFENLCTGCSVNGVNGDTSQLESQGLVFQCNSFNNNMTDISISEDSRIRRIQSGRNNHASGNTFANSNNNIYNSSRYPLDYYFYDSNTAHHVNHVYQKYSGTVSLFPKDYAPCLSCGYAGSNYYLIGFLEDDINYLNNWYAQVKMVQESAISTYNANGFNNNTVDWSSPDVEDILGRLADYDFDRYVHIASDGAIEVRNTEIQFPENDPLSKQVFLSVHLTNIKGIMDEICYKALEILSEESEGSNAEQYRTWVSRLNTIESNYLLAESYMASGKFASANTVLQQMPAKFQELDMEAHQNYRDYYTVIKELSSLPLAGNQEYYPYLADKLIRHFAQNKQLTSELTNELMYKMVDCYMEYDELPINLQWNWFHFLEENVFLELIEDVLYELIPYLLEDGHPLPPDLKNELIYYFREVLDPPDRIFLLYPYFIEDERYLHYWINDFIASLDLTGLDSAMIIDNFAWFMHYEEFQEQVHNFYYNMYYYGSMSDLYYWTDIMIRAFQEQNAIPYYVVEELQDFIGMSHSNDYAFYSESQLLFYAMKQFDNDSIRHYLFYSYLDRYSYSWLYNLIPCVMEDEEHLPNLLYKLCSVFIENNPQFSHWREELNNFGSNNGLPPLLTDELLRHFNGNYTSESYPLELPLHLEQELIRLSSNNDLAGIKSFSLLEMMSVDLPIRDDRWDRILSACNTLVITPHKNASGYKPAYEEEIITDKEDIQVKVYPNPANNTVFISLDKMPETSVNYQLYDIQGKELQNGNFSSQQQELDIASLSKGIYFISVSVENQSRITKKVVKE